MNYLTFMSMYLGKEIPATLPVDVDISIHDKFVCKRLFNNNLNIQFTGKFVKIKDGVLIWKVLRPRCNTCYQQISRIESMKEKKFSCCEHDPCLNCQSQCSLAY